MLRKSKKYYKKEDRKIKVDDISIYEMLVKCSEGRDKLTAINYYGKLISYKAFLHLIDQAALAFQSQGIRKGDVVTICMPNTPEALVSFYAINKIGAIAILISLAELPGFIANLNAEVKLLYTSENIPTLSITMLNNPSPNVM